MHWLYSHQSDFKLLDITFWWEPSDLKPADCPWWFMDTSVFLGSTTWWTLRLRSELNNRPTSDVNWSRTVNQSSGQRLQVFFWAGNINSAPWASGFRRKTTQSFYVDGFTMKGNKCVLTKVEGGWFLMIIWRRDIQNVCFHRKTAFQKQDS